MVKINTSLLPIKAHYFFFMAAMGPILPQISVLGKELGIPADIMGFVTSVLPILYILAKPAVGYLIDYFPSLRKTIFSSIILIMTICYACLYFVPSVSSLHKIPMQNFYNFTTNYSAIQLCAGAEAAYDDKSLCINQRLVNCTVLCLNQPVYNGNFSGQLTAVNNNNSTSVIKLDKTYNQNSNFHFCLNDNKTDISINDNNVLCNISCAQNIDADHQQSDCVTGTLRFWSFVLLMSLGTIGFNVANCVSDATCFDMLGDKTMKYGAQRVWGTIGFGISALIAGLAVNIYTTPQGISIAPGLIVMIIFCAFDIVSIKWLKLPTMSGSESIIHDVISLLRQKTIAIFLFFATLAGIIDSFIIYFMFWHLEEVAHASNFMSSIKLIEGCVVAAECLGGEILFFLISGRILKKIGYVHCLSFCFFMYAVRLALISIITNPWWLVAIELFMQGPTYALCYTCIVAYASAVSPPGATATVQGLVAGMDDGVGFAIGSLIGGLVFKRYGGAQSFRIFSIGAIIVCVCHIILRPASSDAKHKKVPQKDCLDPSEQLKLDSR